MEMTYFILTTQTGFYSRKANITELPKGKTTRDLWGGHRTLQFKNDEMLQLAHQN